MKQYVKLYQAMKSGKMVSLDELTKTVGKEIKMNRLSTYIWELKALGGKFETNRDGKKVVGYKLTNASDIAGKVNAATTRANAKAAKPAKAKAAKPAKAKTKAKTEVKVEASAPKHAPKAAVKPAAKPAMKPAADIAALKSEFGVTATPQV